MLNYVFNNSLDFNFNVEANFTYNYYEKNESLTDDNDITDVKNKKAYKFISINVDYSEIYENSTRLREYHSLVEDKFRSSIEVLNNKILDNKEIQLFNKIDVNDSFLLPSSFDIRENELNKINKYYDIPETSILDYENIKIFANLNNKIQINRSKLDLFYSANKNNNFISNNIRNNIEKTKSLFQKKHLKVSKNVSKISLFEEMTPFKTTLTSDFDSKFYYKFLGFLVEKYKVDDQNNFTKKATKAYLDFQTTQNFGFVKKDTLIWDGAIKYGEKYFYAIYPVFITSVPKKNDYYLTETYLICDYPHFTQDIDCKEFKRPKSPTNISFNYIESEGLQLTWPIPLEETGDIMGYQVFKRKNLDEPYTLMCQIEFFDNLNSYEKNKNIPETSIKKYNEHTTKFIDREYKKNSIAIYTICSIDARGYTSNYGEQKAIFYDKFEKNSIIDLVSKPGAPLHMPNLLIPRKTKFFDNENKIFDNTPICEKVTKFTLYSTPEFQTIDDNGNLENILKDKYKFNIFKLENGQNIIEDINILNFNN